MRTPSSGAHPDFLLELTNKDRALEGIGTLESDPLLEMAAHLKAKHMAENGYFAHVSPDGINPWYWFKEAGYDFVHAGENLAINFKDNVKLYEAWINSPGHKANIVNSNFTHIGIAKATGTYKGREATFVVQLFGRPREIKPVLIEQAGLEEPIAAVAEESFSLQNTGFLSEKTITEKMEEIELIKEDNYESFVSVEENEEDETSPIITVSLTEREELVYRPLLNQVISLFGTGLGYPLFMGLFVLMILGLKTFAGNKIKFSDAFLGSVLIMLFGGFTLYFNSLLIILINARIQFL